MAWDAELANVGALLSEPARCRILLALLDGRAQAASVLAQEAGVSSSTASGHLGRLVDAGWIDVEAHGRYRYYRLVDDDVAEVLEVAARLSPPGPVRSRSGEVRRRQLRNARTCYRHLAGRLGVELLAALVRRGWMDGHDGSFRRGTDSPSSTGADIVYAITERGSAALSHLGVILQPGQPAPHCVDWTEQRHHIGGDVGAELATSLFDRGWVQRTERNRVVLVTADGVRELRDQLGVDVSELA